MKNQSFVLILPVLAFSILSSCSHAPNKTDSVQPAVTASNYTNEEEISFVERVIAQAPARMVGELVEEFYGGLSRQGKEAFLTKGSAYVGSSERLTAAQLAERLEAKSAGQFLKDFKVSGAKYFNASANATMDKITAAEAASSREMHATSKVSSGMSLSNEGLKETVGHLKNLNHSVAVSVVHAHNHLPFRGEQSLIATPKTCATMEKLSPAAMKNQELIFKDIATASDHLEVQTEKCAQFMVAAVTARSIAMHLKPANPFEVERRLAQVCHTPNPAIVTPEMIRAVEAAYPDASKIPENGGACKI